MHTFHARITKREILLVRALILAAGYNDMGF